MFIVIQPATYVEAETKQKYLPVIADTLLGVHSG